MCKSKKPREDTGDDKRVYYVRLNNVVVSRRVPTIDVDILSRANAIKGKVNVIPDSGAEATVAGLDVLAMARSLQTERRSAQPSTSWSRHVNCSQRIDLRISWSFDIEDSSQR